VCVGGEKGKENASAELNPGPSLAAPKAGIIPLDQSRVTFASVIVLTLLSRAECLRRYVQVVVNFVGLGPSPTECIFVF
jgi:hypothetical protein